MPSRAVSITTSDDNTIEFEGELLDECQSERIALTGGELAIELRLWQMDGGGYVPLIHVKLDGPDSLDFIEAEIVDELTDVENFFFVFESAEVVSRCLARLAPDQRQRQCNAIYKAYERTVGQILHRTQPTTDPPTTFEAQSTSDENKPAV